MLNVYPLPAFSDNYIWLVEAEQRHRLMIVDPGEAGPVLDFLHRHRDRQAVAILVTHRHADHVGGIEALTSHVELPVYGPPGIDCVTHPLTPGRGVRLHADFPAFDILHTPGHTREHLCYHVDSKLFCGDTLFSGGCGRLLDGTAAQLHASLDTLSALPPATGIYCAHEYTQANLRFARAVEPDNSALRARCTEVDALRRDNKPTLPSTLAVELATNPFLRCGQPAVRQAAEQHAGRPLADELAVFATLREWKDRF